MPPSLKQKTVSAFIWSAAGQYATQGVTFVITIILARLLEPAEFGMIAMLMIFLVSATTLLNFGFNAALIQRSDVTDADYSTIFFFNVGISLLIYAVLFISAPWIAAFYHQPQLVSITRVYMVVIVITGLSSIHTTRLTKQIKFKPQIVIRLVTAFFSGLVGITMASMGYGVWSLVAHALIGSLLNAVLLWLHTDWRPKGGFSPASVNKLIGFSSRMFATNLLNSIFETVDTFVIGRLFSAADLGYYARAKSLRQFPIKNTTSILEKIVFPVFVAAQDNDQFISIYRKFNRSVSFVLSPLMLGMAAVGQPLVLVLLTDKWAGSVVYLQLLCLGGILKPLSSISAHIIMAKGRADVILNLEMVNKALFTLGMIIGFQSGIIGFLIASIVVWSISYVLFVRYACRMLGYSMASQFRDVLPPVVLSVVMALSVFTMGKLSPFSDAVELAAGIALGVVIYITAAMAFRMRAFEDLFLLIKNVAVNNGRP